MRSTSIAVLVAAALAAPACNKPAAVEPPSGMPPTPGNLTGGAPAITAAGEVARGRRHTRRGLDSCGLVAGGHRQGGGDEDGERGGAHGFLRFSRRPASSGRPAS